MDYEATAPFILLDIAAKHGQWTYPFNLNRSGELFDLFFGNWSEELALIKEN